MDNTTATRLRRLNARIPVALEREDASLAKRLRKPRISTLEGLEMLYAFLDRYLAHVVKGLTACQKGCAYCCHSQVAVSKLEAEYIASKTGRALLKSPNQAMVSEQYCDPVKPCPFVDSVDMSCAIYSYRPLLCRTHISFETDNAKCRFDSDGSKITLLDRRNTWPGAMQAYSELVSRHGGTWGDIREYF